MRLLVMIMLLAALLAGCSDGADDPAATAGDGPARAASGSLAGSIVGSVVASDGPVAGATVTLDGGARDTRTDGQGAFAFGAVPAGAHTLDVAAEFYEPATASVTVAQALAAEVVVELQDVLLAPNVPARYGLLVQYVDEDDLMHVSVGPQGGMTTSTDKTNDRSYYGYWKINAEEGYNAAYWFVNVSWDPGTYGDELGIRYFRGGALADNEVTNGDTGGYNIADQVVARGDRWKSIEIMSEDIRLWGKETWQIGVYPAQDGAEAFLGVNIPYHITITAALLSDEGLDAYYAA